MEDRYKAILSGGPEGPLAEATKPASMQGTADQLRSDYVRKLAETVGFRAVTYSRGDDGRIVPHVGEAVFPEDSQAEGETS